MSIEETIESLRLEDQAAALPEYADLVGRFSELTRTESRRLLELADILGLDDATVTQHVRARREVASLQDSNVTTQAELDDLKAKSVEFDGAEEKILNLRRAADELEKSWRWHNSNRAKLLQLHEQTRADILKLRRENPQAFGEQPKPTVTAKPKPATILLSGCEAR